MELDMYKHLDAFCCYGPSDVLDSEEYYKSTFVSCMKSCRIEKKHSHCRLCWGSFKYPSRWKKHFWERHRKRAITFQNYLCLRCTINHRDEGTSSTSRSHYHCPICNQVITAYRFKKHLEKHATFVSSPIPKSEDEIASQDENDEVKKSPLKYPMCEKEVVSTTRHQCPTGDSFETETIAYSVDQGRGIYLVWTNSHGGIPFPIHVRKNLSEFNTSESPVECENNACMEYMRTLWITGFPSTECNHLSIVSRNAVYPSYVKLKDTNLIDLSSAGNYKMLKKKKVDCCRELEKKAGDASADLVHAVHRGRYTMFSVFSDEKDYYCRLGRVTVIADMRLGQLFCRCCTAKVNCVHKCVCLWYFVEEGLIGCFRDRSKFIDEQQKEILTVYVDTDRLAQSVACSYKMGMAGESEGHSANQIMWNADTEVSLFYAMRGFKPVGINKHFHMMGIFKKFAESLGQSVTSAQIWEHLSTMYNLPVLDESQALPFGNNVEEFQLPEEMLITGKEPAKPKDSAPEQVQEPAKSSSKEPSSKSNNQAKSARKRTRTAPGQSGGAVGPGSNKRKRH